MLYNNENCNFNYYEQEFDNEDHDNRFMLLKMFAKTTAEYFVYLDSTVFLTPDAIPELLRYQKPFISPMCKCLKTLITVFFKLPNSVAVIHTFISLLNRASVISSIYQTAAIIAAVLLTFL